MRVGQIPREPVAYQDRTDLLDQLRTATRTHRLTVVHALTGQRGVGKTQLAAAHARWCLAEDWPIVVWLTGETREQIVAALADFAAHIGIRTHDTDSETAAKAALAWLADTEQPTLLVIDNANTPGDVIPWIPTTGNIHVVVTTTNRAFTNAAATIDVDVYTEDQAVTYLTERTGIADHDGAATVANELGYLPLALAQAAWLISTTGATYTEFLDSLRTTPLTDLLRPADGAPYPRGTGETVLLTATQVEATDPTETTRVVLDTLALLSPAGVPRTLLTQILNRYPDPIDGPHLDRALQSLAAASLITYGVDNTTVLVHRLTQRALRDRAATQHTITAVVAHLITALDGLTIPRHQAALRRTEATTLVGQISNLTDYLHPLVNQLAPSDTEYQLPPWVGDLLKLRAWAVQQLLEIADYTNAVIISTHLVEDGTHLLGPAHPDILYYRDRLATAHQYADHYDSAITQFEAVLTDTERVLGPDHLDTLTARHNLAVAHRDAGHHHTAIAQFEAVLVDEKRTLRPDHPSALGTRHNLAYAHYAAGHHKKAITQFEAVLADRERILGPNHPDTLITRSQLATTYDTVGRHDAAMTMFEAVLADRERILGPDHPRTLMTRHNLAYAHLDAGHLDTAIAQFEAVLAEEERALGPDHPSTVSTRHRLAFARRAAEERQTKRRLRRDQ